MGILKNAIRRFLMACWLTGTAAASFSQSQALSLKQVASLVKERLPELQSYQYSAQATQQEIAIQKNTLVPDVTVGYQANYATYNNLTGMSYPGLLMPITGPPSAANRFTPVPGSALIALAKWNPYTFGQRQAAIDKAVADFSLASAAYDQQLFREQYTALYAYMDLLYLVRYKTALQANIDRNNVALVASFVLTKTGLRAGIDTVQIQAAVAQAEIELLKTVKQLQAQHFELKRLIGWTSARDSLLLTDTLIATTLPSLPDTAGGFNNHPAFKYFENKTLVTKSRYQELEKAWRPHLDLWATGYGRGSGVAADGTIKTSDGLTLSRLNYGVGFQISFPLLQYTQINLQKKQQRFLIRADDANLTQVALNLAIQQQTAYSNFQQEYAMAQKVPQQLRAAHDAYNGMRVSYEKGLVDYTRLVQAEYDLFAAEVNQAGINIQVWRSLLDLAVAKGNLSLFFDQLK